MVLVTNTMVFQLI